MWLNKENHWFKIGFVLTIVVFAGFNLRSRIVNRNAFLTRPIHFDHDGYWWGFPARMYYEGTCFPCNSPLDPIGLSINILTCIVTAAVVGIVFESVANKVRREEPLNLK